MPSSKFELAIAIVFSVTLAAGCQSVQSAASADNEEVAERSGSSSEVRQASATEPVDPDEPEIGFSDSKDPGTFFETIDPKNIWKSAKKVTGYGPNEGVARALYKEGQIAYLKKDYATAAGKFKAAAGRWPDSLLEEDALFYQAESEFFSDQYPAANDTYGMLLKKFDNSRYLDRTVARQFAIGRYWEQKHRENPHWSLTPNVTDGERPLFDTAGHALKAYESVRMNDPTGPLADDSVMATANAYFVKGRYEDASYHYDLLRTEYPKSEHQAQAHLLGLESKERMYQGPLYDATPLTEAGEVAEQALGQFGRELGEEQKKVARKRGVIEDQKAQRDWAMGQFYERKKHFGAARYYYKLVIKEYPKTPHARMSEKRLEEIKDRPDKPAQHFKWLTDIYENKES